MNIAVFPRSKIQNLKSKIINYGRLVRLSHTVFALPFALSSLALAWPKHPVTLRGFFWILIAMVSARTAAMAFNRLVDRKFDALNPRTKEWELPRGSVTVGEARALTVGAAIGFVIAAYQLNRVCFILSPLALTIIFSYSLTKRFTWASHVVLGLALGVAPIGAWLAVVDTPILMRELAVPLYLGLAVLFWLAGFDIIYSLQDREFDRAQGLFSIPVKYGVARSLQISTVCHLCTIVFLAMVGVSAQMGTIYWIGWLAVITVLLWEHRIVSPNDLSRINRAFFDLNAYVSIAFFCATVADVIVSRAA
jgi:4-hydroxybenzoate polyprenyltransferase